MAIRPVDLQLAYMSAPANAAVLSNAQDGPQSAQQAAQAAFAAEVTRREESVDEPVKVEGAKVRARGEREPGERHQSGRRGRQYGPDQSGSGPSQLDPGDDGHLIDVTA